MKLALSSIALQWNPWSAAKTPAAVREAAPDTTPHPIHDVLQTIRGGELSVPILSRFTNHDGARELDLSFKTCTFSEIAKYRNEIRQIEKLAEDSGIKVTKSNWHPEYDKALTALDTLSKAGIASVFTHDTIGLIFSSDYEHWSGIGRLRENYENFKTLKKCCHTFDISFAPLKDGIPTELRRDLQKIGVYGLMFTQVYVQPTLGNHSQPQ